MKITKHIILCLITLCLFLIKSQAQTITSNEVVRSSLDEMFEDLDKSKVPTGYLLDYAMDLVEFDRYNGMELTDSNYVTSPIFEEILLSIKSASVGSSPYNDVGQIMTDFSTSTTSNNINIAYVGYKYNFIKENALENNLISYTSGKVSDVYINGVWQNPYDEAYIFGFTPSVSVCKAGTVNFKFSEAYAFYNISRSSLKFDAGDGAGYRGLSPTHTITVNYATPGRKELKFYIRTTEGVVLETHSSIYVLDSTAGTSGNQQQASLIGRQVDSTNVTTAETYTGTSVTAQVTTYLRSGYNVITKPFIVVEGFDPWRVTSSLDTSSKKHELGSTYHKRFFEYHLTQSFSNDYDIIYVDWYDSTEDIRDNAHLLIKIIKEINQRKAADGCTERTIIMGQSMGGLVTRVALCMMEEEGEAHGISTYISHDSPHLGANVPLGALYFVHHALSYMYGYQNAIDLADIFLTKDIDDAKRIFWEMIHSPAVQQMLVNHLDTDGTLDNSYHDYWQQVLDETGFPLGDVGYPLERLAIVNGAPNNQSDIFAELGQHYLYLDGYAKTTVLTDILAPFVAATGIDLIFVILGAEHLANAISFWGSTKFDIHAEVNPFMSYGTLLSDLTITYTKKFLWCINKTYTIFSEKAFAPPSGLRYDTFAGSKFNVADTLEMKRPHADTWFYKYDFEYGLTDRIMFIPSASALGIYDATELDYLRNFYMTPPVPEVECPFDAYSLTNTVQSHIYIDYNIYNWLKNQLSAYIIGPDNAETGNTYTLSGYNGTVAWSTSNSNVATIDNSGRLTALGNGIVTIIAQSYNNGQLFRKKKDVLVGFPDVVINSSYAAGAGYTFKAISTDEDATSLLAQLVSSGDFQYEWSLIDSDGNMTTKTSASNVFSYLPSMDEEITIAVRLVNADGDKGPIKSLSYDLRTPMSVNYKYVIVDAQQNVYFITDDNTYETGMPTEDFTVSFRQIAMNVNDNINLVSLRQKYLKGNDCYISYPYGLKMTGYMSGVYQPIYTRWSFDFFDRAMFIDELEDALNEANGNERVIKDFYLTICNTNKEDLQDIPFVIIYKPNFPENQ